MKKIIPLLLLFMVAAEPALPQSDFYFHGKTSFNENIPSPSEFLGYPVGEYHTRYEMVVDYLTLLAEKSDRARIETFGYSEELRPQVILTISSPENLANLEQIRKSHLSLIEPSGTEKADPAKVPLVIQLGYNVHGNEASGGEAALLTAYYLVASLDSEMDEILNNSIIFIEPVLNPDGRERFVSWVNMNKGVNPVADPADREHTEAWPGGRGNHYWFDLNRDWLPLSQKESRNRMERFQLWKPNVVTDHHEMGTNSTFFFEPTKKGSENPIITSENYITLNNLFANAYSEALDKIDHYYDSGNSFDNSYPGYGSTYADANGGIAILFEQASTRGLKQETDLGYTLYLKTGILNHLTAALTTVRTAVANRSMLNDYMSRFYRDAMAEASASNVKAYVFGDKTDLGRTLAFAELLQRHGINFYRPSSDVVAGPRVFGKEYAYIVPVKQPQYKIIRTMFEANLEFPDSTFYDASAWAMVYSYGIPFAPLAKVPSIGAPANMQNSTGQVTESSYGYIIEWSEYYAPKALSFLLQRGVRVRAAWEPFTIEYEGKQIEIGRGSLLIPVPYQDVSKDKLLSALQYVSEFPGIEVIPINSAVTSGGPWIGNNSFKALTNQNILLFTGDGISSTDAGSIWFMLDNRMEIPLTRSDISRFSRLDLNRYTTIILPQGNYNALSEQDIIKLSGWISAGGNLIALGTAVNFLNSGKILTLDIIKSNNFIGNRIDYSSVQFETGKHSIGGIFCTVDLDITHPVGFGYRNRNIIVYRDNTMFINPVNGMDSNVAIYTGNPVVSGFITASNRDILPGKVSVASVRKGRGTVTIFVDDPVFRGCWYGTDKLLLNAIFFGPGL